MQSGIVTHAVAGGGLQNVPQSFRAGPEANFRTDGVAISPFGRDEAELEPVAAVGCDVSIKLGWSADVADDEVQCAIIVQVTEGEASANSGVAAEGGILGRCIFEFRIALKEELRALGVTRPPRIDAGEEWSLRCAGAADETIYERDVEHAIVIEVGGDGAEAGAAPGLLLHARRSDDVSEKAGFILLIEGMKFFG